MTSVERIEQDIAGLDKAVATLADEFYQRYSDYLNALSQAVRQQVTLASFQMCTQGYPLQFLQLSLSQRQTLQQSLRELAKDAQANLLAILYRPGTEEQVSLELEGKSPDRADASPTPSTDEESNPALSDISAPARSLTPAQLAEWQDNVELSILKELQLASHRANRLLQQNGILPTKIAETLLQSAGRPELAEVVSSPPNLLNLLIETTEEEGSSPDEPKTESNKTAIIQIVAIQLRLSEIEFADPALTMLRNQLRSLTLRLKKLGQTYRKKEHERAIAQAQDAWRASWYDD